MLIFCDNNIPYLDDALKQIGKIRHFNADRLTNEELIASKADALFVRSTIKVNQDLLNNTNIRFVATATSGNDHFDIPYLEKSGIFYADALGSNANSVAEYVVYAISRWAVENKIDLSTKTIGIIGYGNIGKLVAKYSQYLGLNILVNDPPLKDYGYDFPDFFQYSELNDLIAKSDIITNHVPRILDGKYKTIDLINEQNLELVKPNSLFIHASRGKVVQESALIEIKCQKNMTLITDVWADEPLINKELMKHSLLATPHIAGHSFEGKVRGTLMVVEAFEKFYNLKANKSYIYRLLDNYKPVNREIFDEKASILTSLKQNRQLVEDDKFLRELSTHDDNTIKKGFINYRQKYPVRKETL
ncbi:MAG: NAD(P)-dependent oxidoreductase [bacterium]